ncbi:hypothetical protein SCACP_32060 [Sporomusa carbonis]|uniref:glycosyltransferase family 4 protein n=1 Tax=Sporomusa carbonis TaxID=3076075 RepID=UPI003A6B3DAB
MRVALIHDWLVTYAGAERVLEQMIKLFPEADIYSIVDYLSHEQREFIEGHNIHTSFIQSMPYARSRYRYYLPFMPIAIEQFDLSAYDLILSSSHAVAKGVITGPDQLHISYVHTPIRYAWDLQHQYLKDSQLECGLRSWAVRMMLHYLRQWDYRTANGVDYFIANSYFVARRIWKVYRREAKVIYPPVDIERFSLCETKEDFYLTASRMVPYKKIDLIVEAFREMPDKRLVVIGDGPDLKKIKSKAGANISFLGYQDTPVLSDHMKRAQAFIFAAEEDFGITPVEAQACGTPVIAYGKGGALETIKGLDQSEPTGIFFGEQSTSAIIAAVQKFEQVQDRICPTVCRDNALRFSVERFRKELRSFIEAKLEEFNRK